MTTMKPTVSSRALTPRSGSRVLASSFAAAAALVLAAACSSSSSGSDGGTETASTSLCGAYTPLVEGAAATCASPGEAATGSQDMHCVMNGKQFAQVTKACPMGADADTAAPSDAADSGSFASAGDAAEGGDGGADGDGGAAPDDGTCGDPDYSPTMYGHSGSDDDCKYDVSWTSTPICENGNVYFTVTAKKRALPDGSSAVGGEEPPMTGGTVSTDVVLNCTHPSANTAMVPSFAEDPAGSGVYKVGPVMFDKKGKWNVRFHFNECCDDGTTSPHGHAAFWVNVP